MIDDSGHELGCKSIDEFFQEKPGNQEEYEELYELFIEFLGKAASSGETSTGTPEKGAYSGHNSQEGALSKEQIHEADDRRDHQLSHRPEHDPPLDTLLSTQGDDAKNHAKEEASGLVGGNLGLAAKAEYQNKLSYADVLCSDVSENKSPKSANGSCSKGFIAHNIKYIDGYGINMKSNDSPLTNLGLCMSESEEGVSERGALDNPPRGGVAKYPLPSSASTDYNVYDCAYNHGHYGSGLIAFV